MRKECDDGVWSHVSRELRREGREGRVVRKEGERKGFVLRDRVSECFTDGDGDRVEYTPDNPERDAMPNAPATLIAALARIESSPSLNLLARARE